MIIKLIMFEQPHKNLPIEIAARLPNILLIIAAKFVAILDKCGIAVFAKICSN